MPYLTNKIKSVQYNAALAITGANRETSKEKLCQKLGFESQVQIEDGLGGYVICAKIVNTKQPAYIYDLIPP